jgi:hypothetical protein
MDFNFYYKEDYKWETITRVVLMYVNYSCSMT